MCDESAVVYVCVMDGVHWHLYPPVNLWANAALATVASGRQTKRASVWARWPDKAGTENIKVALRQPEPLKTRDQACRCQRNVVQIS